MPPCNFFNNIRSEEWLCVTGGNHVPLLWQRVAVGGWVVLVNWSSTSEFALSLWHILSTQQQSTHARGGSRRPSSIWWWYWWMGGWRQFSCDPFALCVVLQIISATATTGNNNNNLHPFCRLRFNFTGADRYIITQSRTSHNYGYLSLSRRLWMWNVKWNLRRCVVVAYHQKKIESNFNVLIKSGESVSNDDD